MSRFRTFACAVPWSDECFGLFSEPGSDPLPFLSVLIYTEGGCLFPRWSHLRLASYASIIPGPSGDFTILAQGLLPGSCHTAYRAEIMAACSAVHSFLRPVVTLDCKGVVDTGNSILHDLRMGSDLCFPLKIPICGFSLWKGLRVLFCKMSL